MAINTFMRLALKALSYPDIDLKKSYKLDRAAANLKAPLLRKPIYELWDHKVVVEGREIKVRRYQPKQQLPVRTLLFIHGGGWVKESVDTYHSVCMHLAQQTQSLVLSIEYRLAPEHPFPDGLEDCYAVAQEVFLNPSALPPFPGSVTLIGDSAGGNLCAAVSLLARDRGAFSVPRQILLYPATYYDYSPSSPFASVHQNGRDYLLTAKRMQDYMALYKRNDLDLTNPYFAPLTASDFSRQPDTLIITAEYDPLRDEGEAYGKSLAAAGNKVRIYRMRNALHGFFSLPYKYVHVRRAYDCINAFLNEGETT